MMNRHETDFWTYLYKIVENVIILRYTLSGLLLN